MNLESATECKGQAKKYYTKMSVCPNDRPAFSFEFYQKHIKDKNIEYTFKCLKCGKEFKSKQNRAMHSSCPYCNSNNNKSFKLEVVDYLKSINPNLNIIVDAERIVPKQTIDIYIPEKRLAIDCDELNMHSYECFDVTKANKNYHADKTDMCEAIGLQLVHIFGDEWEEQKDICKSRLANLIGIYKKTIYARKCKIRELIGKEAREFLVRNHNQGYSCSSVNIALEYEGKIVSIMTFCKSRFSKKHEWEVLRFCSELNYHVVGAASKIFKYFVKEYKPNNVISYADRRWSIGKLYRSIGFNCIDISKPAYWYIDREKNHRYNRVLFQKHRLEAKLETYDPNLTETENMYKAGYKQIYDCGNYVFLWENDQIS